MKNKTFFYLVLVSIVLQLGVMFYYFQRTDRLFIVFLSAIVYLIFAGRYYYKHSNEFGLIQVLSEKKERSFELQNLLLKFLARYMFYTIITTVLLYIVFGIGLGVSSHIAVYSGGLGMVTSNMLYVYNHPKMT